MSRVWYNDTARRRLRSVHIAPARTKVEIENYRPERCERLLRKSKIGSSLLIDLIELIGSNNVSSLQKLSKKKGEAPQKIWANICKSRGIELCTIPERILMAGQPTDSQ